MGTDYTLEDMVSEPREKFSYERMPDEPLDGSPAYVVKTNPIDPVLKKESGYKHRIMWILKENFFVVRTDFFDTRGRLIKRQLNKNLSTLSDVSAFGTY